VSTTMCRLQFLSIFCTKSYTFNSSRVIWAPKSLDSSRDKLKKGIAGMKRGKSSGWDGIPPEFYLTFRDLLGQFLLEMITVLLKGVVS